MEEIGIGRPSTYASTISLLTNRTYVFSINRAVWGSPLGYAVSNSLNYYFLNNFMDFNFTKKMEDDLDKISNGELNRQKFTKDFYESLLDPVEKMVKDSNEKDWDPYNRKVLSNFLGLTTEMLPYNLIPTTILCSKEKPAINIRTGEEFTENDPPLEVATEKEIIRETDKNNGDFLMRAIRNKKDGKYFLASKIGENSIYADISAWAGRGRKREYALDKLKESINDLS